MPKHTVLDIVQEILSEMDSDTVNSINDTEEAYQVARIIKSCYYEIISTKYHKYFDRLRKLDSLADSTRPVYLVLPEDVVSVHKITYNNLDVTYKEPTEFIKDASQITSNYVSCTDLDGVSFKVNNNKAPTFWTSFDEYHIVFDSWDSIAETTVQSTNSQMFCYVEPPFIISDVFIPDIPIQMFQQLIAEAKSTSFSHIKQLPSQKAEQRAVRQRRRLSTQGRLNNGIKYPNYGR